MDPVNARFWNLVSGWKDPKTPSLRPRVDGIRILCISMIPSPHPSTSSLWPPNPARSHNNNNNNNGGLLLVFVLQKILSLLWLLRQNIFPLWHYAEQKRIMDNWLAIFIFFPLCWFLLLLSVCIQPASFMRMLRLFFSVFGVFQVGWNLNYSVLSCLQWIRLDADILETMQRKTEGKKIVLVCVDTSVIPAWISRYPPAVPKAWHIGCLPRRLNGRHSR